MPFVKGSGKTGRVNRTSGTCARCDQPRQGERAYCAEHWAEYMKRWRAENPGASAAHKRARYARARETVLAENTRWRTANKDALAERRRLRYVPHPRGPLGPRWTVCAKCGTERRPKDRRCAECRRVYLLEHRATRRDVFADRCRIARAIKRVGPRQPGDVDRMAWLAIIERQGGRCPDCGGCPPFAEPYPQFTIDHIVARTHGGTNHPSNIRAVCMACNSRKGNRY